MDNLKHMDIEVEGLPVRLPLLDGYEAPGRFPDITDMFMPEDRTTPGSQRGSDFYRSLFYLSDDDIKGMKIADLCSGVGNLDGIADGSEYIMRIDPLFKERLWQDYVIDSSRVPEKHNLGYSSIFDLELGSGSFDLVIQSYGIFFGIGQTIGFHDEIVVEKEIIYDMSRMDNEMMKDRLDMTLGFLKGVFEMLRILKPGGKAYFGPIVSISYYNTLVCPTLNRLSEEGFISHSMSFNREEQAYVSFISINERIDYKKGQDL